MNSLEKIEEFAKENYVPIARKQTTEFMVNIIKENNYKSFFELGTAIGIKFSFAYFSKSSKCFISFLAFNIIHIRFLLRKYFSH